MSAPIPQFSNLWPESLLGQGENLDFKVVATYPMFTVPAGLAAVVTRVYVIYISGTIPMQSKITLTSAASAGGDEYVLNNTLNFFTAARRFHLYSSSGIGGGGAAVPIYASGDVFQAKSSGTADPSAVISVYVYGYLTP